jgi:hypothetical protein
MSRRRRNVSAISLFAFQDIITSVVGIFILVIICMILQLRETQTASGSPMQKYQEMLAMQEAITQESQSLSKSLKELTTSLSQADASNRFSEELASQELNNLDRMMRERLQRAEKELLQITESREETEKDKERLLISQAALGPELEEMKSIQDQLSRMKQEMQQIEVENPMVFSKTQLNGRPLCILEVKGDSVHWMATTSGEERRWTFPNQRAALLQWLASNEARRWHFLILLKPSGAGEFAQIRQTLKDSRVNLGFDVVAEDQAIRTMSTEVK